MKKPSSGNSLRIGSSSEQVLSDKSILGKRMNRIAIRKPLGI